MGPFVALLLLGIGYAVAFTRRGSVASTRIGSRRLVLTSAADAATVFDRICGVGSPYRVDDSDSQRGIIVLSSPVSLFSWGFFYPIVITAEGASTRIEVGIGSKLFQLGPVVTHAHTKCQRAIEQALSIPMARAV